ncbi:MAG: PHB depolymerase family esterase [Paracoccaceae bacterium]
MRYFGLSLAICASLFSTAAAAGCGTAKSPCRIANGTYHLIMPPNAVAPAPAVFLLHGFGGGGEGLILNRGIVDVLLARGYAVIAPDGQRREKGKGLTWDFHPDLFTRRDETAFLIAVADDAASRFSLDRGKMLLAGFSIGGSMVSYLACAQPDAFSAYAPVAGSFWRPHPDTCAGPVRLLHTHGTADQTVPLIGREIRPGFVQGNVFDAMAIWRAANGCKTAAPDQTDTVGRYTIERWDHCSPGAQLDFALHAGGHSIPKGWASLALDWFEAK